MPDTVSTLNSTLALEPERFVTKPKKQDWRRFGRSLRHSAKILKSVSATTRPSPLVLGQHRASSPMALFRVLEHGSRYACLDGMDAGLHGRT